MSKLLRMCALVGSLGFPLLGFGQGGFTPDGGESAIAGAMRTDQVHPDAAITHQGGYLVWQDNLLQGERTWIRAHALNTDLAKVGPTFRVNAQPLGNHEKPQVALLRGGGAVFVWEGGRKGFANVYARFLSASGLFITSDIRVNRYTNSFQASPQVATLADGSVVVVWSSSEQDGSFQGVYGQRFSPLGARLGSEFRINQVTANNQRTPAIAALTNGNFVVAWVSELQRGASSVDVFARLFTASSATGTPAPLVDQPNEFAVNLSATNMCANPSVASSLVGGGSRWLGVNLPTAC